ncbi:hypothetical protein IFM47457_08293 [Aspergillus lentulus]|nr:hypothetical protein IFM47457_08293 [Aspergillus lentulus]
MDIPQYPLQNSAGNTSGSIFLFPDDIEYGYSNNPFQFPTLKDLQLAYGPDLTGAQHIQGASSNPKANEYITNGESSGQYIHTKRDSNVRSSAETASCDNAILQKDAAHDKCITKR